MTDEQKKAMEEGRKKYWESVKMNNIPGCNTCTMIEWYSKQMNIKIDKEHCPIKCRYNKEVIDNGNDE